MEEIFKAIETGSVAVIMTAILMFVWRWWAKKDKEREASWKIEAERVRSTGVRIIAQKDELLLKKDEDLKDLTKQYDDRISSIVKTYDLKIKEKDELLNTIREEIQELLVNDTTVKTRLTDSINNVVQVIQNKM